MIIRRTCRALLCPRSLTSPSLSHSLQRFSTSTVARNTESIPSWASPEAREAAEGLLSKWTSSSGNAASSSSGSPATTLTQRLDANQLQLLRITLEELLPLTSTENLPQTLRRLLARAPEEGSPLLPGEHLVYFTPRVLNSTLGQDGTDTSFNPPGGIFTRRMWAGGSMHWARSNLLRVGDKVTERTYVDKVEVKKMGGGKGEMLLVWVRKEFENGNGVALQDRRSWIFQKALDQRNPLPAPPRVDTEAETHHPAQPPSEVAQKGMQDKQAHRLQLRPAELFRYSALTFNGHAIHLDPEWCRQREGHASTVVHGPLNLNLLLRKWLVDMGGIAQKDLSKAEHLEEVAKAISSVEYRAKKPVYAGQTYWLQCLAEKGKKGEDVVQAVRPDRAVIMEASVH